MAIFSSLFSLEEECKAPLCTTALTTKNQELQSDVKRVTVTFEKLQNYINLLALPSVRQDAMPQGSTSAVFTQLAACLHSLHDAIKGEQPREPFFLTRSHSQPA